jgi:hypothetical protein
MLAALKRDHPVFVMKLCTSKNIDGIDVRAVQGRKTVAAVLKKSKLMPGCECALWVDIANNDQYDFTPFAQSRQCRKMGNVRHRAGADDEHSYRPESGKFGVHEVY